jgi:diguanylate cyclase (GGDEF)-like protein/putative nucleotidyltransferase with HDIG domain
LHVENLPSPIIERNTQTFDKSLLNALTVIVVFSAAVATLLSSHSVPHSIRVETDNLTQCTGPLLAAIYTLAATFAAWKRARRSKEQFSCRTTLPAVCLSMGSISFAVGQAIWSYYELVLHQATPFPSWADAGYLCAYPFMFAGILTLPARPISHHKRMVILFDCFMLMSAVFAFSWYFVLGPTALQAVGSTLAKVLGTAYPLSDFGLIFCLVYIFFRSGSGQIRSSISALGTGLVSVIAIDTIFDYQTLQNTYETGHVADVGWTFGYMVIAVAGRSTLKLNGWAQATAELKDEVSATPRLKLNYLKTIAGIGPMLLQYAIFPPVAFLVWYACRPGHSEPLKNGVIVGAGMIVVTLVSRQFFNLMETSELSKKLKSLSENLESEVVQRTVDLIARSDQLMSLQMLTSAVNETLEPGKVLSAAAVHTQQAFLPIATAIWLSDANGDLTESAPNQCVGLSSESDVIRKASKCSISELSCVRGLVGKFDDTDEMHECSYLQRALRCRGVLMGKIGVVRVGQSFSEADIRLLDSICLHVATALENAKQFWNARDAADRDPVTNLLNHRAIHEYLDIAMELESASDEPLAVILADIDNFHMFNDTYGHPNGDEVLRKVGAVLTSLCTAPCKVGRYSGDEYIIVMPGYTSAQSFGIAKKIQDEMASLELHYASDERKIPVCLSYGIASFPEDSTKRQDLLVTADINLTSAKNTDAHIVALSEMQRAHRELRVSSSFRMLDGLVTAVDNKDRYTRRHSEDVTDFALSIADEMGLDDEIKRILRTGGLLHDVGKIGVPDEILHKPSRLTEEEYDIMKQHPTLGALIVRGVAGMEDIVDAVQHHHEHWDGTGYPDALAGEDIPFVARLLAVADAMSAMTTDRPYRRGMPIETALSQIRKGRGTQFDPELADAFLRVASEKYATEEQKAA